MMIKERVNNFRKLISKDEFTKNGVIMFVASIMTNGFNYIYQVYMGRHLGPEDYGIFGALFAIFYMMSIISQTLSTSATAFTSKFMGEGKEIGFFIKKSIKYAIIIGAIFFIMSIVSINETVRALRLPDVIPIIILASIVFINWIVSVTTGILRGIKKFYELGFVNISNSLSKMIFGVIFVTLGFRVSGALLGVAIGYIVCLVISFIFIRSYMKQNSSSEKEREQPEFSFSSFYTYSIPVTFAMIGYSIPSNLDVVIAGYFFSYADAGLYTSASVLGKIIFFFPTAIYAVMFPAIAEKHILKENTTGILKKSLLYATVISGSMVLVYILFPRLVLKVFGPEYTDALPIVAPYGMAMFLFSLSVVMMNYHLAINNMRYITFFTISVFLEVVLLLIYHSSIMEMVNVLLISNLVLLFLSTLYTWRYCKLCEYDNYTKNV